ncbi:MAG: hypothetical protein PUD22_04910 [Erysipelotrichaceae bacterium]|nr:hypothetical protein [Erysipelotrichaceae bacterium]
MGRIGKTGLGGGTSSEPQESIDQVEYETLASEKELALEAREAYLKNDLRLDSPIKIPADAKIKDETKEAGYDQVKYTWESEGYKYESRWHTKTPEAPDYQGNSWVVQRTKPGIACGSNARPKQESIMVKDDSPQGYRWVDKKIWNRAIHARNTSGRTTEQKELLDNGHWKSKK